MKKINYAWIICLACFLMIYSTRGIAFNNFAVYQPFIQSKFRLTNTQLSSLTTVRAILALAAVAASGLYYKHLTVRSGMFLAGIISASSFLLFSFSSTYPGFLIGSALTGIAYGLGTNIPMAMIIERWFNKNRKFASGICTFASSASLIGIPSLMTYMIEHTGIRVAFLFTGALVLAFVIVCFLLIRNHPEDLQLEPYGGREYQENTDTAQTEKKRVITNPGILPYEWWFLLLALALLGALTNTAYGHMTIFLSTEGVSAQQIAVIFSIAGVSSASAKLIYGWLSEKITSYVVNWVYFIFATAGMLGLCLFVHNIVLLTISGILIGIGFALCGPGQLAWAWDLSSPDQYNTAIRRFQLAYSVGAIIFNMLPGILADRCNGSYLPAFIFFTVISIPMAAIVQYLYIKKMRTNS